MQKPLWLKGNKVLSFAQEPSFYAKNGQRYADRGELALAFQNYRKAIDRAPDNIEYKLKISEILTDMERYEESNQWLLRLSRETEPVPESCEFGIGYNYLCMQEYELASSALSKFLQRHPYGPLAEQAEDMLLFIEEELRLMAEEEGISEETAQQAELGKQLLDRGRFQEAAVVLEGVLKQAPKLSYAKNNLALAYYMNQEPDKASDLVRQMVKTEPNNVHAVCNLLIFANEKHNWQEEYALLEKLDAMQPESLDEIYKAALTMAQAGRDESALRFFSQALEERPFDPKTLFCTGIAAYNCKEYAKALKCFDVMVQVDDFFSIAPFYRTVAKKALKGEADYKRLEYFPQLPPGEILQRMTEISAWSRETPEKIRERWENDATFRDTVRWGLHMMDEHMTQAMAEILGLIGTPDAIEWLREALMIPEMELGLKQYIFGVLKRIGAKEPYIALTPDGLMEARVSLVPHLPENLPEAYRQVETLCRAMLAEKEEAAMLLALSIWAQYVETLHGKYPALEPEKMAGALCSLAREKAGLGRKPEPEEESPYRAMLLAAMEEEKE
ncbi:MAG: tetratricopeptide repeat protein [Christensenellales bacterium]